MDSIGLAERKVRWRLGVSPSRLTVSVSSRPFAETGGGAGGFDKTPRNGAPAGSHWLHTHRLQAAAVATAGETGQHPAYGGLAEQVAAGEELEALQLRLLAIEVPRSRPLHLHPPSVTCRRSRPWR